MIQFKVERWMDKLRFWLLGVLVPESSDPEFVGFYITFKDGHKCAGYARLEAFDSRLWPNRSPFR